PNDQKPGDGSRGCCACSCRALAPGTDRGGGTGQHAAVRPLRDAATSDLSWIFLSQRTYHRLGLRLDLRRLWFDRHLPAISPLRQCSLRRSLLLPDRGQMDPHWSVESPRVPGVESDLLAL